MFGFLSLTGFQQERSSTLFSFLSPVFRFSVSNDLKYDAERDLRDIGAKNIQVHSLNKVRSFRSADEGAPGQRV